MIGLNETAYPFKEETYDYGRNFGMTEDRAVIRGTYADYRRVKGRKVLQLIIEVPLEEAPRVHEAFGEPSPDSSTWVAVALLDTHKPPLPDLAQGKHRLSRQAAMCCQEPAFFGFLSEQWAAPGYSVQDATMAAEMVRKLCKVDSRSEFDSDPEAAQRWRELHGKYQAWLLV